VNAKVYNFEARRQFRDKGREIIARHKRRQAFMGKVQQWLELGLGLAILLSIVMMCLSFGHTGK
jgi:FtsH-binding integral membrane protein